MSAWPAGQLGGSTEVLVLSTGLMCLILSEVHTAVHRNTCLW